MKTKRCNKVARCACAIAVKAGGDVFVVNRCDGTSFIGFTHTDTQKVLDVIRVHDTKYRVSIKEYTI